MNFPYSKFLCRNKKSLNLGPKMSNLGILLTEFWKNYCHNWNQCPLIAKFGFKMKFLKSRTQNALLGCFWAEFENHTIVFEMSTLEFACLQNFVKNWKCLNLGQKMSYLGVLTLEFLKTIVIFQISILEFVNLRKFVKNWKCLNLWPKMAYMSIFGREI